MPERAYSPPMFTLHTPNVKNAFEHLEETGRDLTERIRVAEAAGDYWIVDELLKLKIINNERKAKYVLTHRNSSRPDAAAGEVNRQASPA